MDRPKPMHQWPGYIIQPSGMPAGSVVKSIMVASRPALGSVSVEPGSGPQKRTDKEIH